MNSANFDVATAEQFKLNLMHCKPTDVRHFLAALIANVVSAYQSTTGGAANIFL